MHRARSDAGGADLGRGARLRAGAVAGLAALPARDANLRFLADGRFFERDLHRIAQVAAAVHLLARATACAACRAATEEFAEDLAEGFCEAHEAFCARAARTEARAAHV